jgi:hypothetical protein
MSAPTFRRVTCATSGCGSTWVFRSDLDAKQTDRLWPRILAAAGWLCPGGEPHCAACSSMLELSLGRMKREQLRLVADAIMERKKFWWPDVSGR